MSYRCPVCKTPLWQEPYLLRRLKCPRCEAEFRPTVPWAYVRFLLLLIALLGLGMVILVFGQNTWVIPPFIAAVIGFFWYLPRLVNLEQITGHLPVLEGPVNSKDLQLESKNRAEDLEEGQGVSSSFFYLVVLVALVLFILFVLRLMR